MATIWTKEEVIQAASEEFEGIVNHSLIAKAEQMELADWYYDYPIMRSLNKEELSAVYFMFAHFILLALEEES